MEIGTFIFWGIVVVIGLYTILLYNNLVRLKHNVATAWSNIDVLLKQRHDEIPKLVEICKGYMKHERETLLAVMAARAHVQQAREHESPRELGPAETELRQGMTGLFALAEAYPDLKANDNFKHLANRITSLENAIADRREFFNDSVNINNTRIEQFPDVLVARLFKFEHRELLRFDAAVREPVSIAGAFPG